ncbi:Presenilins-associated rhomboid-like protein, mitochondrial [Ooceraea biroi]|uniref:rhomboid protease n=1 Tax=Ooceraea biroi TaxID=2015173 RepID=A0A026WQW9_OOCBI|nr:Presenilins-associated rhomboid-like protein, mitochondrial [Ooceraea biroi]
MTIRTLLFLGDSANKCFFTTVRCCRSKLQTSQYRQARNLRFRVKQSAPNIQLEHGVIQPSRLWKHLGFTVMVSGASIAGAAIWEYERIRAQTYNIIYRYRQTRVNRTGLRGKVETWWRNLSESQRVFLPILFINAVVYLAWRVPALQKTMLRYFSTSPSTSSSCLSMVLSIFSHYSILHLAANMFVLNSFSSIAVSSLGKEQFLALYLSSGVISTFTSHLYKTMMRAPNVSLGASGAIMGIFGFVCTQYPDLNINIIFLPMFPFTAGIAIKSIMAIDVTGCLLRWRYLDHAAHLGGALFGM